MVPENLDKIEPVNRPGIEAFLEPISDCEKNDLFGFQSNRWRWDERELGKLIWPAGLGVDAAPAAGWRLATHHDRADLDDFLATILASEAAFREWAGTPLDAWEEMAIREEHSIALCMDLVEAMEEDDYEVRTTCPVCGATYKHRSKHRCGDGTDRRHRGASLDPHSPREPSWQERLERGMRDIDAENHDG